MAKRANPRHIKAARTYTVEEAGSALGVTVSTVRNWGEQGLPMLKAKRPYLIVGEQLRRFLDARAKKRKCPLGPNQFYCLSCKTAVEPFGMMADYEADSAKSGRLVGLCSHCERTCHRMTSKAKITQIAPNLDLAFRDDEHA